MRRRREQQVVERAGHRAGRAAGRVGAVVVDRAAIRIGQRAVRAGDSSTVTVSVASGFGSVTVMVPNGAIAASSDVA